jgi:hypothetical protein
VELDAFDGVVAVPDAHDRAVLGARGDDERVGQGLGLDYQRVIAGRLEALLDAPVDALAVVHYLRRLAVDGLAAHYPRPEGLPYGLVAEADAEDWDLASRPLYDLDRDAGLVGRARAWRDDYPVRVEIEDLLGRYLVVAPDEDLSAQLPEVLDQVVGERVVVVDDEDPHGTQDFSR